MSQYSSTPATFLADWCTQYQEMSLLGVNPAPFALTDGWTASSLPPPSPPPPPPPLPPPPPPRPKQGKQGGSRRLK